MSSTRTAAQLRSLVTLITAFVFVTIVFSSVVTPLLPGLERKLSLSTAQIGVLVGSYAAGSLVGVAPGAWGAVRFGVKPASCIALLILAASSVGFGLAESYTALLVARFWQGVGDFMCGTAALAWLLDAVPRDRRGAQLGLVLGLSSAGTIVGPLLGAAAATDRRTTFIAVGVATAALALTPLRLRSAPVARGTPLRLAAALAHPAARTSLIAGTLLSTVLGGLMVIAPLQLARLGGGATTIAATFAGSAAVAMLLTPVWGRWSDLRGEVRPARVASVLALLATIVVAWPASIPVVSALQAVMLCAAWLTVTPLMVMLARACTEKGLGQLTAVTLFNLALSAGWIVGSAGGGTLDQAAGQRAAYLVAAALLAVVVGVLSPQPRAQPSVSGSVR